MGGRIYSVAVIGAGTMGAGIAQVVAQSGREVALQDISEDFLKGARERTLRVLAILKEAGVITPAEAEAVPERIRETTDLSAALKGAELVIEAVPEVLETKQDLFRRMDSESPPETILATNTSGISITKIASATAHPERVVGMHWWNPPFVIPVIEIIRGEKTSDHTVGLTTQLVTDLKKKPVLVKKDVPGFLGNRMQYALMREAIYLLEQGVASAEDIDTMVREGFGFKFPVMGPLETIDLAGLDIYHRVGSYLFKELCRNTESPPLVKGRVEEGALGLKSGRGFYDYRSVDIPALTAQRTRKLIAILKGLGLA